MRTTFTAPTSNSHRSRSQRRAAQKQHFAEIQARGMTVSEFEREERERYRREHPVLSGAVPVVPFVAPAKWSWGYQRQEGVMP